MLIFLPVIFHRCKASAPAAIHVSVVIVNDIYS